MEFLKNLSVNIRATGPAAVLVAWIIGVTTLGIFGSGMTSNTAMTLMTLFIGILGAALGSKT